MSSENWGSIQVDADAAGPPGPTVCRLLDGVQYRGCFSNASGRVDRRGDELVLVGTNGKEQPLTAVLARNLEFNIPSERLRAPSVNGDDGGDRLMRILAASPAWARPSIARALAPDRYAKFEAEQRSARKAQLREIGAVVSGKSNSDTAETGNADASDLRAARRAQLQAIGRAVSR